MELPGLIRAAETACAEASARQLAAHRVGEELEEFAHLQNIKPPAVEKAFEVFDRWEEAAVASLSRLDFRKRATKRCSIAGKPKLSAALLLWRRCEG